jgi:hypothetical protein
MNSQQMNADERGYKHVELTEKLSATPQVKHMGFENERKSAFICVNLRRK